MGRFINRFVFLIIDIEIYLIFDIWYLFIGISGFASLGLLEWRNGGRIVRGEGLRESNR